MDRTVIIGCGDIGRRIGRQLLADGGSVLAVARSRENLAKLESEGFDVLTADFDQPDFLPFIPLHHAQVYYAMPPQGGGKSDYRMMNFCRLLSAENCPRKLVYLGTSGVYGDCGGAIVTEQTPINPQTARAQRRASAEEFVRSVAKLLGFELVILRVTGIYGPGRLPVARIMQGHPVLRPEDAPFTNRIHAFDLVRVCLAAMEKGEHGDIFNVSDGQDSTMSEYFTAVADFCQLPRPTQISLAEAEERMNPLMLSYLKESRRMDNRKMREKLEIDLLYPCLAAGLEFCGDDQ
jgi:nucleoside-diphosphate-sugar epimerase